MSRLFDLRKTERNWGSILWKDVFTAGFFLCRLSPSWIGKWFYQAEGRSGTEGGRSGIQGRIGIEGRSGIEGQHQQYINRFNTMWSGCQPDRAGFCVWGHVMDSPLKNRKEFQTSSRRRFNVHYLSAGNGGFRESCSTSVCSFLHAHTRQIRVAYWWKRVDATTDIWEVSANLRSSFCSVCSTISCDQVEVSIIPLCLCLVYLRALV